MGALTPAPALDLALAVLLGVLALALNLNLLGSISIWFDESFSYAEIAQPFARLWHDIWMSTPNMGLYYVLLYGWVHAAAALGLRTSEFVLRLPSAAFAALSTVMVFALGRRFWGRTVALIASGLYALNPMQLFYAQQARAYSLQALLICGAWYALLAGLEDGPRRRRWWVCYTLAIVLAMYAHVLSALFIAAQLVALGALWVSRGTWRTWSERARGAQYALGISLAVAGVLVAPLLYVGRGGGTNFWVGPIGLGSLGNLAYRSISGGSFIYLAVLVALGMLPVVLALRRLSWVARALGRSPADADAPEEAAQAGGDSPPAMVLACWLVVPVALAFAGTQPALNLHIFVDRYLVTVVPAGCLLVALGVASVRAWPARLVLLAALAAVALPLVPAYYAQADTRSFRAATSWIETHYQPGDGIACYPTFWCAYPMRYELQTFGGPAHLDADSPSDRLDAATLAAYAAKHRRVFVIIATFNPHPLPTPASAQSVDQLVRWADAHYRLLGQTASFHTQYQFIARDMQTGVQVRLYTTGAGTSVSGGG
jgi:hypothetical protein